MKFLFACSLASCLSSVCVSTTGVIGLSLRISSTCQLSVSSSCFSVLMGMEYIKNCFNEESTSIPSVPPGFASRKSFTLEGTDDDTSGTYVAPASVTLQTNMNGQQTSAGEEKFSKCLRQRPCINYSQFDNSSDEESDTELPAQVHHIYSILPVIRFLGRDCIMYYI